jgi:enoyl-CoA hydratase/carnithine racemase
METLIVERADGVVTVTLNRPAKKNAINGPMWRELIDVFDEVADTPSDRVLVITGAGDGFCSGADLAPSDNADQAGGVGSTYREMRVVGRAALRLHHLPQPSIAAVNGVAAGAGSVIALAADFRLLAQSASFAFLFTRVGLSGADMGSAYLLPRIVGLGRATELLMLGDRIDAQRALEIGLANEVVPDDELRDRVAKLARRLADGPALAYSATKAALIRELDSDLGTSIEMEALTQALLMKSEDFNEFYNAWHEGRKPDWRGR